MSFLCFQFLPCEVVLLPMLEVELKPDIRFVLTLGALKKSFKHGDRSRRGGVVSSKKSGVGVADSPQTRSALPAL